MHADLNLPHDGMHANRKNGSLRGATSFDVGSNSTHGGPPARSFAGLLAPKYVTYLA